MIRAHKIRLYPTKEQEVQLKKTVGASRYVYNWGLAEWNKAYTIGEYPTVYSLDAKWTKERPAWSLAVSRSAQTRALFDLGKAFKRFFKGIARHPRFHKRGRRDTFYANNVEAYIKGGYLHLPRIGSVRLGEQLRFTGKIVCYIVSFYAGQWHVAIKVDVPDNTNKCFNLTSVVGIDVGLKHIAVASDGTVLDAPKSLKRLDVKLRNSQRALSRSQRNSKNHQKALKKLQKVQNRINNIRSDVTHKFTSTITKNHGVVVVEDLDLKGMTKQAEHRSMRHCLSQSLMGTIIFQLSYKAIELKRVDRFYPSSRLCSHCGHKKETLGLGERTYKCEHCGAVIDRDLNAAINLCKAGMVNPSVPVELAASR